MGCSHIRQTARVLVQFPSSSVHPFVFLRPQDAVILLADDDDAES